jgi:hypothetical protein
MNLLCWNCRGIDNAPTVRELREIATKCAPKVIFLLETQVSRERAENLANTLGFDNAFAVDPTGRSGGIVLFWNNEIKMEFLGYSKYHIDMKVSDL